MTKFLNKIRIDTHEDLAGHATSVIDSNSDTAIPNIRRIDISIQPREPVTATLHLAHIGQPHETEDGGITHDIDIEEAHCPDVDLLPLIALVEQANCGKYRLDGDLWEYLPDGSLRVIFTKVVD